MPKDHIRDYATEAFRFYARWGDKETYVKYLVADLQRQKGTGLCSPTEAALMHKEQVMREHYAEIADLDAVGTALKILDRDVRQAVEMVYFFKPYEDLEWGDIKDRVHYAELHMPASESSIYRWLAKARRVFAEERGLRVNRKKNDKNRKVDSN